jgi:hypothetical protein
LCQAFVEEAQEFQAGVDDSRYRRRERTAAGRRIKAEGPAEKGTPDAAGIQKLMALYCQCLQRCLQVTSLQHERHGAAMISRL